MKSINLLYSGRAHAYTAEGQVVLCYAFINNMTYGPAPLKLKVNYDTKKFAGSKKVIFDLRHCSANVAFNGIRYSIFTALRDLLFRLFKQRRQLTLYFQLCPIF